MLRAEDALQDGEREPNGSRSGIGGAWSPVKMRKRFRRRQREADFRARSEGFLKTEDAQASSSQQAASRLPARVACTATFSRLPAPGARLPSSPFPCPAGVRYRVSMPRV